jgi:hypothetical protein
MSDSADLERRYRRLLAWYPRAFRREHEQEMLSVMMAGAHEGQQRPGLAEAADLIQHAIWMRLRPRVSRSQPTVLWAVRLMYICAALRLLGVPILPTAPGSSPQPLDIGIGWAVFALLAWASSRRHNWARVVFTLWVLLHTQVLLYDSVHLAPSSAAIWTVVASIVFWLIELAAMVLILSKQSRRYYRRKAAQT